MATCYFPTAVVPRRGTFEMFKLTARRDAGQDSIEWGFFDLLPFLFPRVNTASKNFRIAKLIDSFGGWKGMLRALGEDPDAHIYPSLKSMNASGRSDDIGDKHREHFSITTYGLVSLGMWVSAHRNHSNCKEDGRSALLALLRLLTPGLGIDDVDWDTTLESLQNECRDDVVENRCQHVREVRTFSRNGSPEEALVDLLIKIASFAYRCPACTYFLSGCLASIADMVHTNWDSLDFPTDVVRMAPVHSGASKNRTISRDLKQAIVARSRKRKASSALVGAGVFGDDVYLGRCDAEQVPPYMAAGMRVWPSDPNLVLCVAQDAGSFGYPTEDTMLYVLTDSEMASIGAPIVFALISKRLGRRDGKQETFSAWG